MSAPDRPTREQVDAAPHRAAALLLGAAVLDRTLRAAAEQVQDALIARDAEVRALRAELDEQNNELTVRRLQDLVVARTPQPAGPTPEAYAAATRALDVWHTRRHEALRLLRDWETADGLDTVQEWAEQIIGILDSPVAPLPAVPDGEDTDQPYTDTPEHHEMVVRVGSGRVTAKGAIARLVAHGHDLTDRAALDYTAAELRYRSRQYGRSSDTIGSLRYRVTALEADRRGWISHQLAASKAQPTAADVPARLDAAADALAPSAPAIAPNLRRTAEWLRIAPNAAEMCAAVAAALSRPTGDLS